MATEDERLKAPWLTAAYQALHGAVRGTIAALRARGVEPHAADLATLAAALAVVEVAMDARSLSDADRATVQAYSEQLAAAVLCAAEVKQ